MPERQGQNLRFAIVGLGYTGTSLGLALRRAYPGATVIGHDRDVAAAQAAVKAGAVSRTHWNLIEACEGAQAVLLALPACEVLATLRPLGPELAPGIVVTDTASLKAPIVRWAAANLPSGVCYVGGHPLLRHVEPPSADAFVGCTYCLTPAADTEAGAVAAVSAIAAAIGSETMYLDPVEHDGMMAYLQQMPALAAAAALQLAAESHARTGLEALRGAVPAGAVTLAAELESIASADLTDADLAPLRAWLDRYLALVQNLRAAIEPGAEAGLGEAMSGLDAARAFWEHEPTKPPVGGSNGSPDHGPAWRRLLGMR